MPTPKARIGTFCLAMFVPLMLCADTIRVGAAISLREALGEVIPKYEAASGDKIDLIVGASGQIAAQVKAGAPIDLVVSAAQKQVDELAGAGLADAKTTRVIAGNALVLIVPAGQPTVTFESLAGEAVKKLAIGEPKTVPAGDYAQQALISLNLLPKLEGRIVFGANVRQVLSLVERGEVSAGLVYATDAKESGEKVQVSAVAPEGSHKPIVYPGVIVSASTHKESAQKFLDYLQSPEAQAVLKARGFTAPPAQAVTKPAAP